MRTQNRVRISHGKRAIGVRAIEVRLYCPYSSAMQEISKTCPSGLIMRSEQGVVKKPCEGDKYIEVITGSVTYESNK